MTYKDANQPIKTRVTDLLKQMTLQEKVAQLYCVMTAGDMERILPNLANGIGTISCLNSSLTGDNEKDLAKLKEIQRHLVEETRLGIPGLVHNEGIAGAQIPGATTFPQSLNVASTWEPKLANKMGEVVKKQLKAFGIKAVHSPVFDLGRDPRWGRIGETYGEDPYLVAQMGTEFVKGIQGKNEVMATAKHFVGYGNAEGGRNGGEQQIGERRLLDTFCFPFEAAIHDGGLLGVMNSYGILNDQAISTSKWLLTDILREKLGFEGLVVADYGSISHANARYRVTENKVETAIAALKAGMDVEQPSNTYYQLLTGAVESGELDEEIINTAVKRVLEMKFKLGLFENPYQDGDFEAEITDLRAEKLSQVIAEKSIVLVKNENNILPLTKPLKIAVIGPSSDAKINFFGGYSAVGTASTTSRDFDRSEDNFLKMAYMTYITEYKQNLIDVGIVFEDKPSPEQRELIMNRLRQNLSKSDKTYGSTEEFIESFYPNCRSIKEMLEERFGSENVFYAKGCETRTALEGGIDAALSAIQKADIVIAVLGGKESMRAIDATSGENKDNMNIDLELPQVELMDAIFNTGKPVVSVIVDSRPLAMPLITEKSKALLYAWTPAQKGADAIVNILDGTVNPSGKLPVTIVKEKGQIPMYHSRLPFYPEITDWAEDINHDKNTPRYPFGYGLSYTEFEYSELELAEQVAANGKITIACQIKNIGSCDGDEIVQLYLRDCISSIVRPVKQLVGFARVPLKIGESKTVEFEVDMKQLAFHDLDMNQVVEPGKIEVYVAASSQDVKLQGEFEITGEKLVIDRKVFSSIATIK